MISKIFRVGSVLALLLTSAMVLAAGTANPDATLNGCYVAALTQVNEGQSIPVSVECVGVLTDNNVFGFQIGTSVSGDYAGSLPTAYTPGQFSTLATGSVLVGTNTLGLYGVSRQAADTVNVTDFTLGSYTLTAASNLTTADGSVALTFVDATFNLSDNYGAALTGWKRTIDDDSVVVNDIDLAWLSGSATVRSDSNALAQITNVALDLGSKQYTATGVASYQASLSMDSAYQYLEGGSLATAPDSDDTLNISVSADMWGHLACSTSTVNLGDSGAAQAATGFVGTSGVITLKAGDADDSGTISNTDATIMGDDFGQSGGDINPTYEGDVNLDSTINIFDLVHVGRNFAATTGYCA